MSPKTCKYIFSLLLLGGTGLACAQEAKVKPVDSVRVVSKYFPTGVRIGLDAISIIKSRVSKNFTGWEANADVDFYRYFLTVDYGNWSRHDSISASVYHSGKGYYENHGNYFRIGGDVNFMLKDKERNLFFLGFRYGHSSFNERLNYSLPDSTYGNVVKSLSNPAMQGHWAEITTGLRVKIFPGFWMGYTARIKFAPGTSGGNGKLQSFDLPGYGLAGLSNYWGFNYQLFWRIPIRRIR